MCVTTSNTTVLTHEPALVYTQAHTLSLEKPPTSTCVQHAKGQASTGKFTTSHVRVYCDRRARHKRVLWDGDEKSFAARFDAASVAIDSNLTPIEPKVNSTSEIRVSGPQTALKNLITTQTTASQLRAGKQTVILLAQRSTTDSVGDVQRTFHDTSRMRTTSCTCST